jgi:hypothetical protein
MRDANREPLPFPIVYEVLRCLVRDREDSHVRRADPKTQSFLDVDDAHLIATRILGRLDALLETAPCAMPELTEYGSILSGQAADMFFLLTACYHAPRHAAHAAAAAPPVQRPSDDATAPAAEG